MSSHAPCRRLRVFACALAVTSFSLLGSWCPPIVHVTECDSSRGVCPRPEVGVVVDEGVIEKRVWAEAPVVGAPGLVFTPIPNLCSADLDAATAGEELLLYGPDGYAVYSIDPSAPGSLAAVEYSEFDLYGSWTGFVDVDRDGTAEYLNWAIAADDAKRRTLTLTRLNGDVVWQRTFEGGWKPGDIDGDGVLDFAISTASGVTVFRADGTDIATVGDGPYPYVLLGNLDGELPLEVAVSTGDSVTTWALEGTKLGSFDYEPEPFGTYALIARQSESDPLDRIRLECDLYDPSGNIVGHVSPDRGYCGWEDVAYVDDFYLSPCAYQEQTRTNVRLVRFDQETESFTVTVSYSYRSMWSTGGVGPTFEVTRAIIQIHDSGERLVYHEVLDSASGPGSIAVIPSDIEGQELLLVADDTRILAYELRSGTDGGE